MSDDRLDDDWGEVEVFETDGEPVSLDDSNADRAEPPIDLNGEARKAQWARYVGIGCLSLVLIALCVVVCWRWYIVGHEAGTNAQRMETADVAAELARSEVHGRALENTVTILAAEIETMTVEASETAEALQEALGEIEELEVENAALKEDAEQVRDTPQAIPQSSRGSVPEVSETSGGVWTKGQVQASLAASCDSRGVKGSDKSWVLEKGAKIAWAESPYNTQAKNKSSSATGLMQFLSGWGTSSCAHGVSDWRRCGHCSCDVFVRTFVQGGKAKIRQHWAATY